MRNALLLFPVIFVLACDSQDSVTNPQTPDRFRTEVTKVDGAPQTKIFVDGKLRLQVQSKMVDGTVRYVAGEAFNEDGKIECLAARELDDSGKPIKLDEFDVPNGCQAATLALSVAVTTLSLQFWEFKMGRLLADGLRSYKSAMWSSSIWAASACETFNWLVDWVQHTYYDQIDYTCAWGYAFNTQTQLCELATQPWNGVP